VNYLTMNQDGEWNVIDLDVERDTEVMDYDPHLIMTIRVDQVSLRTAEVDAYRVIGEALQETRDTNLVLAWVNSYNATGVMENMKNNFGTGGDLLNHIEGLLVSRYQLADMTIFARDLIYELWPVLNDPVVRSYADINYQAVIDEFAGQYSRVELDGTVYFFTDGS